MCPKKSPVRLIYEEYKEFYMSKSLPKGNKIMIEIKSWLAEFTNKVEQTNLKNAAGVKFEEMSELLINWAKACLGGYNE